MLWLTSSKLYSQVITLNDRKDTMMCFSLERSRFLLNQYERSVFWDSIAQIRAKRLEVQAEIIQHYQNIGDYNDSIINNLEGIQKINDYIISGLTAENKTLARKLKTQKILKCVGTGLGVAVGGFCGFKAGQYLSN
jgi:hypothetical protein